MIEHFTLRFIKETPKIFVLTLNEHLLATTNRIPFKKFFAFKPRKWGIEFYTLCDADANYLLTSKCILAPISKEILTL